MSKLYFKFYAVALVFLIAIAMLFFLLKPLATELQQSFVSCAVFFSVLSPLVFYVGSSGLKSTKSVAFLTSFYGSFMLKLFVSLIFVMIYLWLNKPHSWHFIASFGIGYFLFSGIETFCLMKAAKK